MAFASYVRTGQDIFIKYQASLFHSGCVMNVQNRVLF